MNKRFLPIGSVVQLKDSTARVMITGYLPISAQKPGYVWDYSGFHFPLGFVHLDDVYCFNHDQIERICSYGYRDLECDEFLEQLEAREQGIREQVAKKEME